MAELPEYTIADLEAQRPLDVPSFTNDDAVDLGLSTIEVIRQRRLSLAVRIVLRGVLVFAAKLGSTDADNDRWMIAKERVVHRFGEPSLLVRRRREADGVMAEWDDEEKTELFAGGSLPIFVAGELVGTITVSGEPDVVDHEAVSEAVRRFRLR